MTHVMITGKQGQELRDPIASPEIARLMLPGVRRLKTTIGRRLSMHSEMAVASITFKPCSRTWR